MRATITAFSSVGIAVVVCLLVSSTASGGDAADQVHRTVTLMPAQGKTRTVDFTTEEGTWMSVDVSPEGQWLVFDLLGHIYRMPPRGGEAQCLTGNSGPAINVHPRISPDGKSIAFVSDRAGQENLWIMDADGSRPRPVSLEPEFRHREPAWTPDSKHLLLTRQAGSRTGYIGLSTEIWKYPVTGGSGERIAAGRSLQYRWPAISPDGKRLYYFTSMGITGSNVGASVWQYVQSMDLDTGVKRFLRDHSGLEVDPGADSSGPDTKRRKESDAPPHIPAVGPAELAPEPSPDGKWIAFATRLPGRTQEYRGHHYGPRTALVLRSLETGKERILMDPISIDLGRSHVAYSSRVLPGYGWSHDSKSIFLSEGGKIWRLSVETGDKTAIPFRARVQRTLSEQARGQVTFDENSLNVKFLQWPASSPDGRRLAFVAIGKIWLVDLPEGKPRPLTPTEPDALQLTPAWSPDGSRLAFTSWSDLRQGHVWSISQDGSTPRRHTTQAGQYLYPAWSPDGTSLVVMRGPGIGPPEEWNGWEREGEWTALRLPTDSGTARTLATAKHIFRPHFGPGGRVYYALDLGDRTVVRSVAIDGEGSRDHVRMPARGRYPIDSWPDPLISPDGRWVAYQAARSIYVAQLPSRGEGEDIPFVETDPNAEVAGRVRIGDRGGIYHGWRDATTLELVSGTRHITYDAAHNEPQTNTVQLRVALQPPKSTIALTRARVITLEGERVMDDATVIVQGARIKCVGECDTGEADQVLDLAGKVIVPGFVDVHAHHTRRNSPVVTQHWYPTALDLAYGITTILDPATLATSAFPVAEMTAAGVILGPRIYSTAENAYGWGDRIQIRSEDDARFKVNWRTDWGAISLKNYRMTRRKQQQLFIQAARERGVTVTAEGGFLHNIVGMTIDGQTGFEHFVPHIPMYRDVATFLGRAHMVYSPTVSTAGHYRGMAHYYRPRHDLLADAKYRRFTPRRALERVMAASELTPITEFSFPFVAEGLADVIRAGGYGAIGEHGEQPGIGSHWEIWSYAEALTPLEALTVASKHGAYFIGLDKEIGSIAPGKLADLVILNADPLDNIRNTADIAYVMKGGRLYDDDTLDEIWPEQRKYGPVPWR